MKWLDDILALLEEGNLSRAADRRNITQPAFSRRIRSFEDWLGVSVLTRKANSIEISESLLANETEIRALSQRLRELRTKVAHYESAGSNVAIAAQHAAASSAFPAMALQAKLTLPKLSFRLRAANLGDCVSMFLRGDTSMLLCYEAQNATPMQFGASVQRGLWGHDYLIPVVGGALRYSIEKDSRLPENSPAIVYPDNSYFGDILRKNERQFATADFCINPVCQSAFSSGIREMILAGVGVGWLPLSMVSLELESGQMVSLANTYGQEPLDVALYASLQNELSVTLIRYWTEK